jgi:general secretion pathway protein K
MARANHIGVPAAQRGIVLVTAVLIVAVAATVAAALALGQQVWLRQTENLTERAQADSLRYSALSWTGILLARDTNNVDDLSEPWAQQLPPLPAEGGLIAVTIHDAQGLFNLNNLVFQSGKGKQNTSIAAFSQLLQAQGLDPTLVVPLVDWIDANSSGPYKDDYYLSLQPPYRTANQPLTSVDELRLVRGFTPAVVKALRPYVTALPESTTVNINTADGHVLAALITPAPSPETLQPLLESRKTQPFKSVAELQSRLPGTQIAVAALSVETQYFLVNIGVRTGRLETRSEALIERKKNQPARVLWHRLNPLQLKLKTDEKT